MRHHTVTATFSASADEVFAYVANVDNLPPDRRDQVATCQLGQHPGVDPIGLAGQRRQPLHLLRIGDLDLPAG
jgi:hypothetical protein